MLFKKAIDEKNVDYANRFINYDSLRNSLKKQLSNAIKQRATVHFNKQSFPNIKLLLINPILETVVDLTIKSTVKPKGLERLITKGELSQLDKYSTSKIEKAKLSSNKVVSTKSNVKLYYKNYNTFVLSSKTERSKNPVKAIWKRSGIIQWKLSSIELPEIIINEF